MGGCEVGVDDWTVAVCGGWVEVDCVVGAGVERLGGFAITFASIAWASA